jgi:MFS family permease
MAILLGITVIPVWFLREPGIDVPRERVKIGYLAAGWLSRLMVPGMLAMAGLIFCYRFGDQMVSLIIGPFLSDYGLSKETIALMKGTVGSSTSVVGALLGGWFTFRVGRRQAILISGLAQAGCFVFYILAAANVGGMPLLWWATILEGIIGTMATVALFTLMMDASDPEHAGTDYTLLASVVVLVSAVANFATALIADRFDYVSSFIIGTVLAVIGCMTVIWILDRYPLSERIQRAWRHSSI